MKRSESETPLKQEKFRVFVSALFYGSCDVFANSEEEAKIKAQSLFQSDSIPWHENEVTDMTVENIDYDDGGTYFIAIDTHTNEHIGFKDGDPIYFESEEAANNAIFAKIENTDKVSEQFWVYSSVGICKRCGSPLFRSFIDGYKTQCFTCDEDFYECEQETKE